MLDPEHARFLKQARSHLSQVQTLEPTSVVRSEVLGVELNFEAAVEPLTALVTFYRQFPLDALSRLPPQHLRSVEARSGEDLDITKRLLAFKATDGPGEHASLLQQVRDAYYETFHQLHSIAAFLAPISLAWQDQRQSLATAAAELQSGLLATKAEAEDILASMRKAAAETGVTRHAIHFKHEADTHKTAARLLLIVTCLGAVALIWIAAATLVYRNEPWLRANGDPVEAAQIALSKALIFGSFSFLVVFASRSYMSNRHNQVVNRHRQNALATYSALAKSAGEEGNRDIILTKAAECIFAAQPTGFAKSTGSEAPANVSLVSLGSGALKQ